MTFHRCPICNTARRPIGAKRTRAAKRVRSARSQDRSETKCAKCGASTHHRRLKIFYHAARHITARHRACIGADEADLIGHQFYQYTTGDPSSPDQPRNHWVSFNHRLQYSEQDEKVLQHIDAAMGMEGVLQLTVPDPIRHEHTSERPRDLPPSDRANPTQTPWQYRVYGADFEDTLRKLCPKASLVTAIVTDPFTLEAEFFYALCKSKRAVTQLANALRREMIPTIIRLAPEHQDDAITAQIAHFYNQTPPASAQRHATSASLILHLGVTETNLLLLKNTPGDADLNGFNARNRLWFLRRTSGYYNRAFKGAYDKVAHMAWHTHMDPHVVRFLDEYRAACDAADWVSIDPTAIDDAINTTSDGVGQLRELFPDKPVRRGISIDSLNAISVDKPVIVVSPFAELIEQQHNSGMLKALRPDFSPTSLTAIPFPYCFMGQGPHADSFETIARCCDQIAQAAANPAAQGATVLLGCGAMGPVIAGRMHQKGHPAANVGGNLQLFFGIMGGRWRERHIRPEDKLLGSFVTNPELWIDPIPDKFIPDTATFVENKCYW